MFLDSVDKLRRRAHTHPYSRTCIWPERSLLHDCLSNRLPLVVKKSWGDKDCLITTTKMGLDNDTRGWIMTVVSGIGMALIPPKLFRANIS